MRKRKSGRAKVSASGADLWAHGYARAALERMMRIHRLIEDGEYPNCTTMSQEFEMSVRTLKRDIEFMKDRLKMPIAFAVPKNGYFFTKPQPHFPTACRQTLEPRAICGLRSRSYVLGAVGV